MTSPAIPWSVLRAVIERRAPHTLAAITAELADLGFAVGAVDEIDRALERAAAVRSDADEIIVRGRVRTSDTDPRMPAVRPEGDGVLEPELPPYEQTR
jgi:hypothetical protein